MLAGRVTWQKMPKICIQKCLFLQPVISSSYICVSGEEELSFGFDGAGKAVTGGKMEEFGEPFGEGDVIGCYAVCCKEKCSVQN